MQRLDFHDNYWRKGDCCFDYHPVLGVFIRRRPAVEAKPGIGVNELTYTVDELGNPDCIASKVDSNRVMLAKPQELALDRTSRPGFNLRFIE